MYIPKSANVSNLEKEIFSLVDLDDYITAYDSIDPSIYDVRYDFKSLLNHQPELRQFGRVAVVFIAL